MSSLDDDDFDLENLDVTGGDEDQDDVTKDDIEDAPVVRFVNKVLLDAIKRGASTFILNPMRKYSASEPGWTVFCLRLHSRLLRSRTKFVPD